MPTKSELIRTDSNAISEENADYMSANNPTNQTEIKNPDEENTNQMEDLLYHASNADIEFMKQSLSNIQELMMKEVEEMNKTNRENIQK